MNEQEKLTKLAIHLIRRWFNFKLTNKQKLIVGMVFSKNKRSTIRATTRYGKSQVLALSLIIYAILYDNKRIGIIAPTHDKSKFIMNYILTALASCPEMANAVDLDLMELSKLERLKREVSKKKITFKSGSSITILTADIKGKGFAVMGAGFDLTAIDETAELTQDSYSKIYRMLVENPDAKIVEIGNPWHLNHFYEHHYSEDWDKLHINWKDAVSEGRMTEEDVMDQKKNLTELEFTVLFEAEFPENIENSIFKKEYLDLATTKKECNQFDKIHIGVDVARGGKDLTVITVIGEYKNEFYFIEFKALDTNDVMPVVGETLLIADKYKYPVEIKVDTVGLGAGVKDRLAEVEHKYKVYDYMSGKRAKDKTRFFNIKSEDMFGLADIMKQGRFYNLPENSKYILEARKMVYIVKSDRQVKVEDPSDKSPDYIDSLNIAMAKPYNEIHFIDANF